MKKLITALLLLSVTIISFAKENNDSIYRRLPHTVVAAGGAVVINAAVTEGFKHGVHELRPDRTENNSFPSRHTSWAFTASTVLSNELYRYSPWWSLGAQALSSAVGIQRVASRRHWGSDVVAGAVTGILSTELAYFVSRKIFGMPSPWQSSVDCDFRPSLAMSSEALFILNNPAGRQYCTGFGMSARFRYPMSEHWGLSATLHGFSMPVKAEGRYYAPLSSVSLSVGAAAHFRLPCPKLAVVCNSEIGPVRWVDKYNVNSAAFGFAAEAGAGIEWHLTSNYGFRGQVDYRLMTVSHAIHAISFSLSSLVLF